MSEEGQQSVAEQQRAEIAAANPEPVKETPSAVAPEAGDQNATHSDASEGTSGDDGGNPPAQPRGKNWAARKIDQLTREREQALAQSAQLATALQQLTGNAGQPAQPQGQQDRGPQRDQYQDYEQFIEARADWRAQRQAQAVVGQFAQHLQRSQQQMTQQQQAQRMAQEFQSKLEQGKTQFADWDDIATSDAAQVPMGEAATVALTQAEKPAEVVYWLMKNPAAAAKFASLNLVQAAAEIGRIEARLQAPTAPSNAPKPGKPAGARGGVPGGFRDDMSMEEFVALRRKKG